MVVTPGSHSRRRVAAPGSHSRRTEHQTLIVIPPQI